MNTVITVDGQDYQIEGMGKPTLDIAFESFPKKRIILKGFLAKNTDNKNNATGGEHFIPINLRVKKHQYNWAEHQKKNVKGQN